MARAYWLILIITIIFFAPDHSSAVNPSDIEKINAIAEAGDSSAQYRLGLAHYYGKGVKQDFAVAAGWFNKAAEQKEPDAAYMVSVMLKNGEGFEQNEELAKEWLDYSAKLGSDRAKEIIQKMQSSKDMNKVSEKAETTAGEQPTSKTITATNKSSIEDKVFVDNQKEAGGHSEAKKKITTEAKGGVLSIEAGIEYKYSGVQPVSRTDFYILDKNIFLKPDDGESADYHLQVYAVMTELSDKPSLRAGVEEATVQSTKTDFSGKAKFKPVVPGEYFVFGTARLRKGVAVWNVPIKIERGENSLILAIDNATISR